MFLYSSFEAVNEHFRRRAGIGGLLALHPHRFCICAHLQFIPISPALQAVISIIAQLCGFGKSVFQFVFQDSSRR
jgi:hypothetical protein